MKNILLLTDFSDLANYARSLADKVAHHTGSTLHILKVVNTPSEVAINPNGELIGGMSDDLSPLKKDKEDSIAEMSHWTQGLKSNMLTSVQYGSLFDVCKTYVEKNNIDLIVMGTHGVSGLQEFISGSVTEHVILKSKKPVLSLKCDRENIDFSDFLITGEFEDHDEYNLETLKALQGVFNSNMHLLWINTKKHFMTSSEAISRMKEFAKKNKLINTHYHIHNDESLEDGIVNFANNYDATHDLKIDIIAVEKKQKSQLGYMISGCQATSFVNHIFRPIITYLKEEK